MRNGVMSAAYKRDVKRTKRQGKNLTILGSAVNLLLNAVPLPPELLDHPLKGKWKNRRELHIAPGWLLIYHVDNDTVYLDRTGSHADLFS
jgi:mRNA interferase YafQ